MKLKNDGFTIVEIIIALTILSFMVIGIYTVVDNNIKTKETVLTEDQAYLQAYNALFRFEQDFTQIWSPLYYSVIDGAGTKKEGDGRNDDDPFTGEFSKNLYIPREAFPKSNRLGHPIPLIKQEEKSELIFLTTSNRRRFEGQKQSHFQWVRYSLGKDEDKEDFVFQRQTLPSDLFREQIDWSKIQPQPLLRNVKSLKFEFWNKSSEKWVDALKDIPAEKQLAPDIIRVVLERFSPGLGEQTIIRVFRPLWPNFDVKEDNKLWLQAQKPKKDDKNKGGKSFDEE